MAFGCRTSRYVPPAYWLKYPRIAQLTCWKKTMPPVSIVREGRALDGTRRARLRKSPNLELSDMGWSGRSLMFSHPPDFNPVLPNIPLHDIMNVFSFF